MWYRARRVWLAVVVAFALWVPLSSAQDAAAPEPQPPETIAVGAIVPRSEEVQQRLRAIEAQLAKQIAGIDRSVEKIDLAHAQRIDRAARWIFPLVDVVGATGRA